MKIEEALEYVTDTAHFETGEVLAKVGPLYKQFFGDRKGFIIADESTYAAAGEKTAAYLTSAGIELGAPRIFPAEPMLPCEYEISMVLRDEIKDRKAVPIAVGSGTINDLVKVAAFEAGTKYMVVATAASVDGYSAPGASMVRNGFKNSIYCTAPYLIIADTEVLSSAPDKMTSAGYADLSSKYTAGADWIIADCVRSDPIDDLVWRMVQEDLDLWLENPAGVISLSETAFAALFRGLTMTGLAMQKAQSPGPPPVQSI